MLRFIVKNKYKDGMSGVETEFFHTVDCDVPDLESLLKTGGAGENTYNMYELVGVEVLRNQETSHEYK